MRSTNAAGIRCALILILCTCVPVLDGCSLMFPVEAGESLAHFADEAPRKGDEAPNVRLTDLEGNTVWLHDLLGQPVVVQLGSYTCPVFRYRRFDMQPLRERYADKVVFVVLYTQEAHPVGSKSPYADGEWVPWMNRLARIDVDQPQNLSARTDVAAYAQTVMRSNALFLVDGFDNRGWQSYGRAPSAAYVLDATGRIRLAQPWIYPEAIERLLDTLTATNAPIARP